VVEPLFSFVLYFKDSGVEGTNAHLGFAGLEQGFVDFAVDMKGFAGFFEA
jgi:hypothetical protein